MDTSFSSSMISRVFAIGNLADGTGRFLVQLYRTYVRTVQYRRDAIARSKQGCAHLQFLCMYYRRKVILCGSGDSERPALFH